MTKQRWRSIDKDGNVVAEGEAFQHYDEARGLYVTEIVGTGPGERVEIYPPDEPPAGWETDPASSGTAPGIRPKGTL